MIALLDNGQDLDDCAEEMGVTVGQVVTPLTGYRLRKPELWAADNGGFKVLDVPGLMRLLERLEPHRSTCLFVAVPDIVAQAQRTLELFAHFAPMLSGWPLALVCQDGQESLPIPWDKIAAVFIGGSTNWKCGPHAEAIVKTAKILGKHVHIGRVNDPNRWRHFEAMGAESADGTGIARYTHMREAIAGRHQQGDLYAA